MAQFNRTGEQYFPAGYPGVDYATARGPESPAQLQDGLYYRTKTFPGLIEAVQACLDGEQPYEGLSVDAYQSWNETGWKQPHVTLGAGQRFYSKGSEEQREVDDALEEFFSSRDNAHLVEELGDYLWVITGYVNNSGAVVGDAIKQRLFEYIVGTKVYVNGEVSHPEWYDAAAELAIKRGQITVGDLDGLLAAGFVPRFSPIMNLYEDEEICATAFVFDFQAYNAFMRGLSEQRFAYGEHNHTPTDTARDIAESISIIAAEAYFRVAAIAYLSGASLSAVVQKNVEKVSHRIQTGTVDKSDGPRTK